MKKVIIIGCPGAGKSTFARRLRDATGLPLYYLDMIWHKADKTNITRQEFDLKLSEIVKTDKCMRLIECDTVFLLDLPLSVCLAGAEARIGTKREDMPWKEDRLDDEFRDWIMNFSRNEMPRVYELLRKYKNKNIIVFRSRAEVDHYEIKSGEPAL